VRGVECRDHRLGVRIGIQRQILLHQGRAQPGIDDAMRGERVVEALSGDVPEIGVLADQRAQP
jgi:hypothetical protein